jgi:alanyl-tRNA synthetase
MRYDDAIKAGALAFFGDKYGDRVTVVRMGSFSTELCGGRTSRGRATSASSRSGARGGVAAGVRRVEAASGEGALELIRSHEALLHEISTLLRGPAERSGGEAREAPRAAARAREADRGTAGKARRRRHA